MLNVNEYVWRFGAKIKLVKIKSIIDIMDKIYASIHYNT